MLESAIFHACVAGICWGVGPLGKRIGVDCATDVNKAAFAACTFMVYGFGTFTVPVAHFLMLGSIDRNKVLSESEWVGRLRVVILAGVLSGAGGIAVTYALALSNRDVSSIISLVSNGVYSFASMVLMFCIFHDHLVLVQWLSGVLLFGGILLANASQSTSQSTSHPLKDSEHAEVGTYAACQQPTTETASKPTWSVDFAYSLGHTVDDREHAYHFLDAESYPSVQKAVDALNAGTVLCPDGRCIVRSERQKLYFLVARSDKRDKCAAIAQKGLNIRVAEQPFSGGSDDVLVAHHAEVKPEAGNVPGHPVAIPVVWAIVGGCLWGCGPAGKLYGVGKEVDNLTVARSACTFFVYNIGTLIPAVVSMLHGFCFGQFKAFVDLNWWKRKAPLCFICGLVSGLGGILGTYALALAVGESCTSLVSLIENGLYVIVSAVLIVMVYSEELLFGHYCSAALIVIAVLLATTNM